MVSFFRSDLALVELAIVVVLRWYPPESGQQTGRITLSNFDREFMRSLKIIADF